MAAKWPQMSKYHLWINMSATAPQPFSVYHHARKGCSSFFIKYSIFGWDWKKDQKGKRLKMTNQPLPGYQCQVRQRSSKKGGLYYRGLVGYTVYMCIFDCLPELVKWQHEGRVVAATQARLWLLWWWEVWWWWRWQMGGGKRTTAARRWLLGEEKEGDWRGERSAGLGSWRELDHPEGEDPRGGSWRGGWQAAHSHQVVEASKVLPSSNLSSSSQSSSWFPPWWWWWCEARRTGRQWADRDVIKRHCANTQHRHFSHPPQLETNQPISQTQRIVTSTSPLNTTIKKSIMLDAIFQIKMWAAYT